MSALANQRSAGPATTPAHALDRLRAAIGSSELRPGQRVGQEEVAAAIGVSVAPVREALRTLEQEGQVTYVPRRGYFVTELAIEDLEQIYELRQLLEARAARRALPKLGEGDLTRIRIAATECAEAAQASDIVAQLGATRRLHFAVFEPADQPHLIRLIQLLWDSTEAYRALYYNSPGERLESIRAHDRMIVALMQRDSARLIAVMDEHRERALRTLRTVLLPDGQGAPTGP
jgi:DNA-binding GntR family transcriptional regulator